MVHELTLGPATLHALTERSLCQQMICEHIACLARAPIVLKHKRCRERVCCLESAEIKSVVSERRA